MIYVLLCILGIAWFVTSLVILINEGKKELATEKRTLLIINMILASIAMFFVMVMIAVMILGILIVANM